jgi:hypothetical protein
MRQTFFYDGNEMENRAKAERAHGNLEEMLTAPDQGQDGVQEAQGI